MFPYNLLPETPGINAVNNKKAGLMSHEAQTPATPPKYISKSSHTSIPVPLHISDSPARSSTQSTEISTELSIFILKILCSCHGDQTSEGCMIIWMAGCGQICDSIIRLRQESLSLVRGFAIGRRNVMGGADGRPSRYTSLSLMPSSDSRLCIFIDSPGRLAILLEISTTMTSLV